MKKHISLRSRAARCISLVLVLVFGFLPPVVLRTPPVAQAQSVDEIRAKMAQLEAEISRNNAIVADLESKSNQLQDRLNQLQAEINAIAGQIELTQLKIDELTVNLDKATAELERQKGLLKANVRELYKGHGASSLELLVGSDSFSSYFNEQTYLEKLKTGITESAKQVQELKKQIADQKKQQEDLLLQQKAQKGVLDDKKSEQQSILAQTQGEQAKYEGIVAANQAEFAAAQEQLREVLRQLAGGGSVVSYGYVLRGQRVGSIGSTGISTGPHTHFAVYDNGGFINPRAGGNNLVYGFTWPVPTRGWGDVSQEFGCTDFYLEPYEPSCPGGHIHQGMDIGAWYGEPVVAAADGNIVYRDWMGGYGFSVIIDHGGGLLTYYPHMQPE